MAGEYGLACRRAQPHRAQRRHTADEAIHYDGQIFQRTTEENAAQPGDIKPAQRGQHAQWVRGVGVVDGDAALNGGDLAAQPGVRQPRPAPGHRLHRLVQ